MAYTDTLEQFGSVHMLQHVACARALMFILVSEGSDWVMVNLYFGIVGVKTSCFNIFHLGVCHYNPSENNFRSV